MDYWRKHTSNNTSSSTWTTPTLTGTNSCAIHRSFICPLDPSLLPLPPDPSPLQLFSFIACSINLSFNYPSDPLLAPSIAPSIAPSSIACSIHRSIYYPWSIACNIHRSLDFACLSIAAWTCCSYLLFNIFLPHFLISCLSIVSWCTPCSIYRSFPDQSLVYSIIPSLVSIFISHNTISVRWAPKFFANTSKYIVNLSLDRQLISGFDW